MGFDQSVKTLAIFAIGEINATFLDSQNPGSSVSSKKSELKASVGQRLSSTKVPGRLSDRTVIELGEAKVGSSTLQLRSSNEQDTPRARLNHSTAIQLDQRFFALHGHTVATNGFSCFPLPPGQKRTYWKGWPKFCSEPPTAKQIADWQSKYPDHGMAVACGWSTIAADIDSLDEATADALEGVARRILGNTPLKRVGKFPKRALVYAVAPGAVIASKSVTQVDLIGDRRFIVGYGIHPDTGQPYIWETGSPATVSVSQLPAVTPAQVARFLAAVEVFFIGEHPPTVEPGDPSKTPLDEDSFVEIAKEPVSTSLVLDGRDTLLTNLVYRAYGTHSAADAIADAAWIAFRHKADLRRPKRDGRKLWSYQDALTKARALLASGKPRPRGLASSATVTAAFWDKVRRERFEHAVNQACATGLLTRTDTAVSHAMLTFIPDNEITGSCFASCETVAARVGCRPASVKKARRRLRQLQLWEATHTKGGRGLMAYYRPRLEPLCPDNAAADDHVYVPDATDLGDYS
jgi:hypothetical protein